MNRIEKMIADLCPNGVEWKELGEVVEILDNLRKPISKENRISGKYPYYGANGIQDYVSDYLFEGEYILMGEDGSVIDKNNNPILHFVNGKIWVNNHAHILSKKTDNLRFIYYCLSITNVRKLVRGTPPKINQKSMSSIKIPIPPLEIQEEIVKILDTMTEHVTELQSELQMRTKQYEYYREELLTFEEHKVEWKTLGDFCEIVRGNGLQKSDFVEQGIPCIHYGQIYTHYGLAADKTISFVTEETASKLKKASYGDVIVATTSENVEDVGKCLVWEGNEEVCIGAHSCILKPSFNSKYLTHYFNTHHYKKQKEKLVIGTKVIELYPKNIEKVILPIPSLEIQEKIVYVLDNFDKVCNDLNIGLPKEIELRQKEYEYYREKLLTFDVKYGKPTLADTSRHEKLLRLYQYVYGYVKVELQDVANYSKGRINNEDIVDYTYVSVENLLQNKLGIEKKVFNLPSGKSTSYNPGDILLGNIRPYLRKIWLADCDGGTNGDVLVVQKNSEIIESRYLYYILSSEEFFEYNISNSKGAKMPRGDKSKILEYKFFIPSLEKQKQIVEILDKFDELVNSTKSGLNKEIELRQKQYEFWREKLLTF